MKRKKIIRVTTVPISLKLLLKDQLKFLNKHYEIIAVASEGKELQEVEKKEAVKTISLNMTRRISPLRDLISLIQMVVLIKKENPEMVHSHTPKAGLISMIAATFCKVPIRAHTVAGLPVMNSSGFKKIVLMVMEWITCKCATKIFPNSIGLQIFLNKKIGVSQKKMKIIGAGSSNGIDENYFSVTPKVINESKKIINSYGLENKFTFLFIGRIVEDKGVNELLKAFEKLYSEFKNISLFLVGEEETHLNPISISTKSILINHKAIESVGFIDDVRPYLALSKCLILPSHREGFPNVLLQACSMGVPSITTNINGCNEIIKNKYNGLIIKPKNSEELLNAMKKILLDQNLLNRISNNARESIKDKFNRKKFHKLVLNEYRNLFERI